MPLSQLCCATIKKNKVVFEAMLLLTHYESSSNEYLLKNILNVKHRRSNFGWR